MSVLAGLFNTTANPAELNARSFAGTILRRAPNGSAPLFAMTALAKDSKAKSSTHGYFSKTMVFATLVLDGAIADSDQTVTVTTTAGIVPTMVFYNQTTGENVRVLTVVDATTLTVQRGFGRIAADAMADGERLLLVGNAHAEGSPRPTPRSVQAVYVANFTQIWRNSWALTDTARASYAEEGYSNIAESRWDCMNFHSQDIESSMFFGQASMGSENGQPLHSTQGIIDAVREHAPLNVATAPAETSYDDLVDMLLPAFSASSDMSDPNTRIIYCDATAMRVFQDIGRHYSEVSVNMVDGAYGQVFSEFRFFKGRLMLREHPLFNGIGSEGLAVVVDAPAVRLAYLDGRKTKNETFGVGGSFEGSDGIDAQGGSLTTEAAVELLNPQGCAVITGLVKAKEKVVLTKEVP